MPIRRQPVVVRHLQRAAVDRERAEVGIRTAELQGIVAIHGKTLCAANIGDVAGHHDRPIAGPVKLEGIIDGQHRQVIRDHHRAHAILNELILHRCEVDSGAGQCLGGGRGTTGKLQLLDGKLTIEVIGRRE